MTGISGRYSRRLRGFYLDVAEFIGWKTHVDFRAGFLEKPGRFSGWIFSRWLFGQDFYRFHFLLPADRVWRRIRSIQAELSENAVWIPSLIFYQIQADFEAGNVQNPARYLLWLDFWQIHLDLLIPAPIYPPGFSKNPAQISTWIC